MMATSTTTPTTEPAGAPPPARTRGGALFHLQERSPLHWALRIAGWVVLALIVLRLPYAVETFRLGQITDALIITIAVVGLNLLTGFTGQVSIGHAAFYGLGAYTTGVLIDKQDWTAGWTMPVAFGLCFVVGVLVGIPALRLKGLYLVLVTLAVGVIFPSLVRKFDSITGGSLGIKNIEYDAPNWLEDTFGIDWTGRRGDPYWKYWLTIFCLGISLLITRNLIRSRQGRALIAARDNPTAAAVMGVHLAVVKTVAFGFSAAIAGLAGSLYATKVGVLTPEAFDLLRSIEFLVAMIIGGIATLAGPVIGGIALFFIQDWVRDQAGGDPSKAQLSGVILGGLLILFMFVMPGGVVAFLHKLRTRLVAIVPKPPRRPDDEPELARRSAHEEEELQSSTEPTVGALGET